MGNLFISAFPDKINFKFYMSFFLHVTGLKGSLVCSHVLHSTMVSIHVKAPLHYRGWDFEERSLLIGFPSSPLYTLAFNSKAWTFYHAYNA